MTLAVNLSDVAPLALFQIDDRRRIDAANTEAQMLLGHSESALRGKALSEFIYHDSPLFDLLDRVFSQDGDVSAHGVAISGPGVSGSRTFDIKLRPVPPQGVVIAVTE